MPVPQATYSPACKCSERRARLAPQSLMPPSVRRHLALDPFLGPLPWWSPLPPRARGTLTVCLFDFFIDAF